MRLAILAFALLGSLAAGCVPIPPDVAETFAPPAPHEANNYGPRAAGAAAATNAPVQRASATPPSAPSPSPAPTGTTGAATTAVDAASGAVKP
jgi:hypothetical protein